MSENTLPARHNIDAYIDLHTRRSFRWLIDGVPADLTEWSGRVRLGHYGEFVTEVADAVTVDANGNVTLDIPAGTVPTGSFWYVLDLADSNGAVTRFLVGAFRVLRVFP